MKIFISWSGKKSHLVAIELHWWIKCVLQATTPWLSSKDIDRGSLWFNEIGGQLSETVAGIVCLTHDNKNAPWILFEAGALAKGLSTSRVMTFLIDLEPSEIRDPLAQFNHTTTEKESVLAMLRTINKGLDHHRLDTAILDQVFARFWPDLELKLNEIKALPREEPPEPKRTPEDTFTEINSQLRTITTRFLNLERAILDTPQQRTAKRGILSVDGNSNVGLSSILKMARARQAMKSELLQRGCNLVRQGVAMPEVEQQLLQISDLSEEDKQDVLADLREFFLTRD